LRIKEQETRLILHEHDDDDDDDDDDHAVIEYPVLSRNVNKQFVSTVLVYIFAWSLTDRLRKLRF
jgi:hypothetical protein